VTLERYLISDTGRLYQPVPLSESDCGQIDPSSLGLMSFASFLLRRGYTISAIRLMDITGEDAPGIPGLIQELTDHGPDLAMTTLDSFSGGRYVCEVHIQELGSIGRGGIAWARPEQKAEMSSLIQVGFQLLEGEIL